MQAAPGSLYRPANRRQASHTLACRGEQGGKGWFHNLRGKVRTERADCSERGPAHSSPGSTFAKTHGAIPGASGSPVSWFAGQLCWGKPSPLPQALVVPPTPRGGL